MRSLAPAPLSDTRTGIHIETNLQLQTRANVDLSKKEEKRGTLVREALRQLGHG